MGGGSSCGASPRLPDDAWRGGEASVGAPIELPESDETTDDGGVSKRSGNSSASTAAVGSEPEGDASAPDAAELDAADQLGFGAGRRGAPTAARAAALPPSLGGCRCRADERATPLTE